MAAHRASSRILPSLLGSPKGPISVCGFRSQRSGSVGVLDRSIKFNELQGRKAYMKCLDKIYKQSDISWFTPVELFKPWYAHGIAEAILRTANLSVPLKEA